LISAVEVFKKLDVKLSIRVAEKSGRITASRKHEKEVALKRFKLRTDQQPAELIFNHQ